jgi:hypothetical protein
MTDTNREIIPQGASESAYRNACGEEDKQIYRGGSNNDSHGLGRAE